MSFFPQKPWTENLLFLFKNMGPAEFLNQGWLIVRPANRPASKITLLFSEPLQTNEHLKIPKDVVS